MTDPTQAAAEWTARIDALWAQARGSMPDGMCGWSQARRFAALLAAAPQWIRATDRMPEPGQLIVKRWDHNGGVWAGMFNGSPKDSSFDEWIALP